LSILEAVVWVLCAVIITLVIRHLQRANAQPEISRRTDIRGPDLFDTASIGFLEIDRKGIVRRVNPQFSKLLGVEAEQLVGKYCDERAPAAQREKYAEQMARRMAGEAPLAAYHREYERADGGKLVLEIYDELLKSESGEVLGLRMAAIDATQRKNSDDQAMHAAAELRALFQAFPDLFLRLDGNGVVQEAKGGPKGDPVFLAEKLTGQNLKDVLPQGAMEQFAVAQDRVKRTKAMAIIEFSAGSADEQQIYEMRLLGLDWEQWIAIVRNITVRKVNETKLKDYAQELERKNEEMEAALLTAHEATKLKSRFMANISHEIRTPINGVLGMTELLLGTALRPEQQDYAESIKKSATSLLSLINDILDLSRVEAGKLKVIRESFSLKGVLAETSSLFALQARAKGLDFVSEVSPHVPAVAVGDPGRLRQILNNLLANAIKFTDAGRIVLTATLDGETSAAGVRVRFAVHDTGIGIAHSDQELIFERFMQADASSTRKYGGTGLGLAISKELVELLGGEIGVESEPDRGSRFWFTVELGKAPTQPAEERPAPANIRPVAQPESPPSVVVTIPVSGPGPTPATKAATAPTVPAAAPNGNSLANLTAALRGKKHKVLLAEDNEINQRITMRLLEKLGVSADAVANGRAAVDAAGKKPYDLVFMDCQMPEMDGFEATAMIRNHERNRRHTPICALTANAMEGDRERCLAAGMDDYVTKPVSLEKLQEAMERWIPGARVSKAASPSAPAGA